MGRDSTEPIERLDTSDTVIKRTKKQEAAISPGLLIAKTIMTSVSQGQYGVTTEDLGRICDFDNRTSPSQLEILNSEFGGLEGLAYLLQTDLETGLRLQKENAVQTGQAKPKKGKDAKVTPFSIQKRDMTAFDTRERQETFGQNIIPPPKSDTILEIVWGTIVDDPILKILIIGAIVILALGTAIHPSTGWTEGVAIIVAVLIVLIVTAGNDWSKDRKFKKLLLLQTDKKVKILRGGHQDQISSWDLMVGDIVEINVGDEVAADGIFVKGNRLIIDESPLTGESIPVKKNPSAPYIFSGCQVSEGSGIMLVTAVGPRSSGGKIQELLNEAQNEETVLQEKLKVVAVVIGKVGFVAGILTFIALTVRTAIKCSDAFNCASNSAINHFVENFVIGITVVVVAVPEGLPLAVTISLAFSMFKMIQDKCFVRHLDASETMGEATCICTDKTGTLTENRMTVVKVLVGEKVYYGEGSGESTAKAFSLNTFESKARDIIAEGICLNSTCYLKANDAGKPPIFVGSASEGALIVFCEKLNARYEALRDKVKTVENGVWLFSSERKRMSTLVIPQAKTPTSNGELPRFRLYTKGGSEIVLELCKNMLSSNGQSVTPITPNDLAFIQRNIKKWASQGLRTMVLAYRDTNQQLMTIEDNSKDDPEHDLTFIGLIGIKDPLRREVPGAVAICQKAGITIRMVTGDNILTASKIARECGIMYGNGIALEGPIFRNMSREEKEAILPKLQVLARSSPSDKHVLVSLLKELGEVVAVTGDGTNDAPALKEADVGFAMGISGTQIAMNASDIVLLDDNFVSIVQSIKWGRNVLNSVRKFLQFQLSVNLVAISVTFVGSANQGESPLNTIQLLWVNLIMDSLGALGLATDDPSSDILLHPPHARNSSLISRLMWENMFGQLIYQLAVLFGIYFGIEPVFRPYRNTEYAITGSDAKLKEAANVRVNTMLFGTFVYLQVINLITSRQLDGEIAIFKDLLRNKIFVVVWVTIVVIQTLVLLFGNAFMNTSKMDSTDWQIIIVVSLVNLIFVFIQRVVMKIYHSYYPVNSSAHKVDPVMQDDAVVQKEGSVPVMTKIKKTTTHKESEEETQKLMVDMNERVTKILENVPKKTKNSSQDEVNGPSEFSPRSSSNHSLEKKGLVNNMQKSVSKSELIDNSYTMEPENHTGDLRTTSRTTSLIELIHPFRKDSNAMPLKSSTSRSTLSLRKQSKSSL